MNLLRASTTSSDLETSQSTAGNSRQDSQNVEDGTMDNAQLSSQTRYDKSKEKVQRADGGGLEKSSQLQ